AALLPSYGRRRPARCAALMPTPVSPGECQMRLMMLRLVIGCTALAFAADAGATSWTSAKVPGEQSRAVQGCADDAQNPGDWFCIFIRCDRPGAPLSLYFSAPGPDIRGDIKLVVDEDTFTVSVPTSSKSALPLSTRARPMSEALIYAIKAGVATWVGGSNLQAPYNRVSLDNWGKAIAGMEWVCSRHYPSAARFWRRITRGLGFW